MRRHRLPAGFTLAETLVVLALIGLLAAVLAPGMIPTPNNQLRADAAELIGALRQTRLHAMRTRASAALQVNTEHNTYQLPERPERKLEGDYSLQLTTAQRELTGENSGGIRFYPDGSSTGGRITLSNGGLTRHVDVAWLTGRVRLLEEHP